MRLFHDIELGDRTVTTRELHGEEVVQCGRFLIARTLLERGVAGVLKHLKMRSEGAHPVAHPVWLGRNEVLRAGFTGLLYPMVEPGQTVSQPFAARVTRFAHYQTLTRDCRVARWPGRLL